MYVPHPSLRLQQLFQAKPYQGARPEDAEFIFIGLDANYAPNLERMPLFHQVEEYHEDGVAFWQRYHKHHPFLLGDYQGDGRWYHYNFAKIDLQPQDARRICFIEMLHVPTCGTRKLEAGDLDADHMKRLDALITSGRRRRVFVPSSVAQLMRDSRRFSWLGGRPPSGEVLPVLYAAGETRVHQHLHFSNWGTYQSRMTAEAVAIGNLVKAARAPATK